jgi:hypothetical protein
MSKYSELIQLLEEIGVMQLDDPWAEKIKALVKKHKTGKVEAVCHQHAYHLGECTKCGAISNAE